MSDPTKERLLVVLESIHLRLVEIELGQAEIKQSLVTLEGKVNQVIDVQVQQADEQSTVRTRMIEESSRRGEEIHRHQRAILEHEARIYKLEQANGNPAE